MVASPRPDNDHTVPIKPPHWTHSLKWRIVATYSLILIVGGVSTSIIGIRVTGRAFLQQAHQQVEHGLAAARNIYVNRLNEIDGCVELVASGGRLQSAMAEGRPEAASEYLAGIRRQHRLDFLSLADPTGRTILRSGGARDSRGTVADLAPIARALAGEPAASTEIVPAAILQAEDPVLAERARIKLIRTPKARPRDDQTLEAGMVLLAAAPVADESGRVVAVLYGGQLLNDVETEPKLAGSHWIVDEIRSTLLPTLQIDGRPVGTATIFQDDVRVTTTVMTADGRRAIGTRVSQEVYDAVMGHGSTWTDRAFVVNDWYITAYQPISNLAAERIGILYVGVLERPYTAVRDNVTASFAAIALFCFVLIVVATYFLTRSLVRPLEQMVSVSNRITAGDLSQRVRVSDQSELGLLAGSFNDMLDRIDEMKSQLQQSAKTLEQKVAERTQQLIAVQSRAARQERLASVGQLAAGVAHEINNPLGGILTFASLVREELPPDSPYRADLDEVVNQAVRCREIVANLLEFSRQREAQMVPADLNEILTRTLALLEKQAKFHDIKIERRLDPELPRIVVDESQMQQVFMNIILNAADAMDERGSLTIRTGHDASRRQVFVRISDTGCGIAPDYLERVFDPFFTTKDPGKGTGLGLAVSCRIVQGHGGRMDIESEVAKGTTFIITLPLSRSPAGEGDMADAPAPRSSSGPMPREAGDSGSV